MPYRVNDIIKLMEEIAPPQLAESWDNVGLLVGSGNQIVKKIMVTLDVTAEVIREAAEKEVNLIICHHPVLFKPVKSLTDNTITGAQIAALIRSESLSMLPIPTLTRPRAAPMTSWQSCWG